MVFLVSFQAKQGQRLKKAQRLSALVNLGVHAVTNPRALRRTCGTSEVPRLRPSYSLTRPMVIDIKRGAGFSSGCSPLELGGAVRQLKQGSLYVSPLGVVRAVVT